MVWGHTVDRSTSLSPIYMYIPKCLICTFISFSAAFAHGQSNLTAELDFWHKGKKVYRGVVEIDLDGGEMRWKPARSPKAGPDGETAYTTNYELIEDSLKDLDFYPRGWLIGLNRSNKSFMLINRRTGRLLITEATLTKTGEEPYDYQAKSWEASCKIRKDLF